MKDTITYKGLDLEIEYDWNPAESQTHDHQGCAAHVGNIYNVMLGEHDIFELLQDDDIENIETLIEQKRAEYSPY